ncbi:MAG: hypothetical protein ABI724_06240 [Betaproteobacteria bacterium]
MKIASHLDKFRRLDATLRKLDAGADQELWIWTAMNAGVNLLNAALHACSATSETDSFHTQVEGLYAVPERATGVLRDAMHPPGDVMHVGQPAIAAPLPPGIERASAALRVIEDLRERFVRGSERAPADVQRDWHAAYATCVSELTAVLRAIEAVR